MNNLELQQKIYDFEIILYGYLKKFPQAEKFAMTTEIKKTVFELYRLIYKASKLENKKTSLRTADVELQHLRHLLRLANEFKFISKNGYAVCSKELFTVGNMLGSWIKNIEA